MSCIQHFLGGLCAFLAIGLRLSAANILDTNGHHTLHWIRVAYEYTGACSWIFMLHQDEDEPATQALDEDDVVIMRTYGRGPQSWQVDAS